MNKSSSEIFNNKVSLIYEYDKHSPLFVRMANTEIEFNNVEKAIEILVDGIKTYPQYSAAYLLLGKAYTLTGNYGLALKNIKLGSDLIHSPRTYNYYLKELENIKKQRSLFEGGTRNIFVPEGEISTAAGEHDLFKSENLSDEKTNDMLPVEDRLDEIADKISRAKIPEAILPEPVNESLAEEFASSNMIVSETLAKIYVAQGELKEAISVFQKLMLKNPDKKEYYSVQIRKLESELDS